MFDKKNSKKSESKNSSLQYQDENFLPYACYLNKTTLLTKNGDIIKMLKIPSLISSRASIDMFDVRSKLKSSINNYLQNEPISFWFHTIRKKADIMPFGEYANDFSSQVGKRWCEENKWDLQYVNEVYVSFVLSSKESVSFNPIKSMGDLFFGFLKNKKLKEFYQMEKKLSGLLEQIIGDLSDYGISVLTIKKSKKENSFHSPHMKFLSFLVNLEKPAFTLTTNNLSEELIYTKTGFGNNIIEVDNNGKKKFASILSLKHYFDLENDVLDKLLQSSVDFIITQVFIPINKNVVISKYKEQIDLLKISQNKDFLDISGLNDVIIFTKTSKDVINFYTVQTTFMLMADSIKELDNNVSTFYKVLDEVGFTCVREDLCLATCFWSQMPANFNFICRKDLCPALYIGGFASLYNFPLGQLRYNYWGNAVTVLKSTIGTPYFFNFHYNDNGNCFIFGPSASGKTTTLNFLISEATKLCKKIFYIDCNRSSEVFINALNGKYYRILNNKKSSNIALVLNPFSLEKNEQNLNFLVEWLITLISYEDDKFVLLNSSRASLQKECEYLYDIINKNFDQIKSLSGLVKFLDNKNTQTIFSKLQVWYGEGDLASIFDNTKEISFDDDIIGVDLSSIIEHEAIVIPIVNYLSYKILNSKKDNNPFIFAIDNAWQVFDNSFFDYSRLEKLCLNFISKNIAFIITTNAEGNLEETSIKKSIQHFFGSEIFLPNTAITIYQKNLFSLDIDEIKIIKRLDKNGRQFLLKCKDNVIVASLEMSFYKEMLTIFVNDNISINAMKKAKELTKTNDSEEWLPVFFKIIFEYEKQQREQKIKEKEMRQLKWEEKHLLQNTQQKIVKN